MDDAVIVLAAAGALRPVRPDWNPADPVATWLEIGRRNVWIAGVADPPFTHRSVAACNTAEELREHFEHGNWSLGCASASPF